MAARARAKSLARSNTRSLARRGVLKDLNALAAELRVGVPLLSVKAVGAQALSQYWRVLNKRCVADPHRSRFRELAQKFFSLIPIDAFHLPFLELAESLDLDVPRHETI